MTTIMPEEKKVQDAVQWISERRQEYKEIKKLVDDAIFHFNLNPNQEQYLYRVFLESTDQD